ncbi:MAG: polysaccharide export protein [Verrucomicrobiota bacterium]|nr:polysaccharide export protein [Verrucomicrobiota bacterium]
MKTFLFVLFLLSAPAFSFADAALRAGDSIEIRIGGVPQEDSAQVSGQYTIDGEGNVNMPYIGKIHAGGQTTTQVQKSIEAAYKSGEIYTNPTISISTQEKARFVNVSGEVKAPQRVAYTADLTLLSAITAAGGFSDYADQKRVQVSRGGQKQVIDIRQVRRDPSKDVQLLPGDQIQVPQSFF